MSTTSPCPKCSEEDPRPILEPFRAQLDGFLCSVMAILGCELTILKATPTFTRPILVPFPKVFPGTTCSDGDDGCAVGDGSTGGSGLSKRKYPSTHIHIIPCCSRPCVNSL